MDKRMSDAELDAWARELFKCDFSTGTEKFREELLEKCLALLEEADEVEPEEGRELADEEIELLAAAGDPVFLAGEPGKKLLG